MKYPFGMWSNFTTQLSLQIRSCDQSFFQMGVHFGGWLAHSSRDLWKLEKILCKICDAIYTTKLLSMQLVHISHHMLHYSTPHALPNVVQNHDDVIKWKNFPRYWPLCGEFTGPGEFPAQRPVTRSFDVFFDLGLNKRLSKQPRVWWFETPSWSLWRQCNAFNKRVFFYETPQLLGVVFPQRISPTTDTAWCHRRFIYCEYIDGSVQESRNSSALAMELRLSCINVSILGLKQRTMGTTFAFFSNIVSKEHISNQREVNGEMRHEYSWVVWTDSHRPQKPMSYRSNCVCW